MNQVEPRLMGGNEGPGQKVEAYWGQLVPEHSEVD